MIEKLIKNYAIKGVIKKCFPTEYKIYLTEKRIKQYNKLINYQLNKGVIEYSHS